MNDYIMDLKTWDIKMLRVENVRYKNSRVDTVNNNVLELRK